MCRNCMKFNVDGSEYFVFAELFLEETAAAFYDDAKRCENRANAPATAETRIKDIETAHESDKVVAV
jgi:hypothetical protein